MRFLLRPVSNPEIALLLGAALAALVYFGIPRVTVHNSATVPLGSVTLTGRGFAQTVDAIPPGESRTFWFLPAGDTSLRLTFLADDRPVDTGDHGYYAAPPRPQFPSALVIDQDLRPHFRRKRLPFAN